MFKRDENKALYRAVKRRLVDMGVLRKSELNNHAPISDNLLDMITELNLDKYATDVIADSVLEGGEFKAVRGLTDFTGIDKLRNLEKLTYSGIGSYKAQYMLINGEDKNAVQTARETHTLKDLSMLSSCTKLKELNLDRQVNLTEIDLSCFPNLERASFSGCPNLQRVAGLDKIVRGKDVNRLSFNFRDCENLRDVENFSSIAKSLRFVSNEIIDLPIRSYCYLFHSRNFESEKQREDVGQDLNTSSAIRWCEVGLAKKRDASFTSVEMQDLMGNIDALICRVTTSDMSVGEKIRACYEYITDNVRLYYEDNKYSDKNFSDNFEGCENYNVRTAYGTLKRGQGVCAGISNLFGLVVADFGVPIYNFSCCAEPEMVFNGVQIPDHQCCRFRSVCGKDYFFDPTWDSVESREYSNRSAKVFYGVNLHKFMNTAHLPLEFDKGAISSSRCAFDYEIDELINEAVISSCSKRNEKIDEMMGTSFVDFENGLFQEPEIVEDFDFASKISNSDNELNREL